MEENDRGSPEDFSELAQGPCLMRFTADVVLDAHPGGGAIDRGSPEAIPEASQGPCLGRYTAAVTPAAVSNFSSAGKSGREIGRGSFEAISGHAQGLSGTVHS